MAGPERTANTTAIDPHNIQPPRPPNAWILFRADMARTLPPAPGGRRPQSDVSKQISAMWNAAEPHVKAEYERRAEEKKAEHAIKFPNYRFMPKKKEEKDRLKEEKKKGRKSNESRKTRAQATAPYTAPPYTSMPIPIPIPMQAGMPYFPAGAFYGPFGPSPPMSAAGSPPDSTLQSELGDTAERSKSPHALSPQDPISLPTPESSHSPSAETSFSSAPTPSVSVPADSDAPSAGPSQWASTSGEDASPAVSTPGLSSDWSPYVASSESQALDTPLTQEFLTFDIPQVGNQSSSNWYNEEQFRDSMHAFLSATGDPSIFQMSFDKELDPSDTSEIELSLGGTTIPPGEIDFSTFDLEQFLQQPPGGYPLPTDPLMLPPVQPSTHLHGHDQDDLATNQQGFVYNADDYINYEAGFVERYPSPSLPSPHASSPYPTEISAESSSRSYVPPAGAANSSNRRVGGSWKPPYPTPDAGIEPGPSRQWSVPAN